MSTAIGRQHSVGLWAAEARATLSLAWPLILAQLAQISLNATDTLMMGWLGPQSLAAGALAFNVYLAIYLFGLGVVTAVAPMVSQARGARQPRQVRRAVRQAGWAALIVGVPASLFLWQVRPFLLLLGQQPDIAAAAEGYMRALLWGLVPGLWYVVLRITVAAMGRPRAILPVAVVGLCLNALGNYALMFGHFGFPALGLVGAGISTAVVNVCMMAMLCGYVVTQRHLRRYALLVRWWRPDWPTLREVFRIGLPVGAGILAEAGLFAATAPMMGLIGTTQLAAHAIAMQYAAVAFMVPLGVSQAATIRVGLAAGARDRINVGRAGWVALSAGAVFTTITALLFWLAPWPLVALFLDLDQPANVVVATMAVSLLAYAALFQLFDGAQVIGAATLRGLKDTRTPMLQAVFGYWVVGFTSCVLLAFPLGLGAAGVWIGLALGLAVVASLFLLRFHRRERLALVPTALAPAV